MRLLRLNVWSAKIYKMTEIGMVNGWFLNWQDLTDLLGSVLRFPHSQRQELERPATLVSFQSDCPLQ